MDIHKSITDEVILAAVERRDDYPGFRVVCGHEVMGVEPDARDYRCESCGEAAVYGAEELLLMTVA